MKIDHAKVVVRYKDGRVVKGTTLNFDVRKPGFLLRPLGADEDTELVPIRLCDLKAIFFNTSLKRRESESHTRLLLDVSAAIMEKNGVAPDPAPVATETQPAWPTNEPPAAEATVGPPWTPPPFDLYNQTNGGFFLVPADPRSNNERVYVLRNTVVGVERM